MHAIFSKWQGLQNDATIDVQGKVSDPEGNLMEVAESLADDGDDRKSEFSELASFIVRERSSHVPHLNVCACVCIIFSRVVVWESK